MFGGSHCLNACMYMHVQKNWKQQLNNSHLHVSLLHSYSVTTYRSTEYAGLYICGMQCAVLSVLSSCALILFNSLTARWWNARPPCQFTNSGCTALQRVIETTVEGGHRPKGLSGERSNSYTSIKCSINWTATVKHYRRDREIIKITCCKHSHA